MARRDEVGTDLLTIRPQFAELEPNITYHAWIRRPSREILIREVIFDPREVVLEIERVKGNIEAIRNILSIEGVGHAAASL